MGRLSSMEPRLQSTWSLCFSHFPVFCLLLCVSELTSELKGKPPGRSQIGISIFLLSVSVVRMQGLRHVHISGVVSFCCSQPQSSPDHLPMPPSVLPSIPSPQGTDPCQPLSSHPFLPLLSSHASRGNHTQAKYKLLLCYYLWRRSFVPSSHSV